MRILLWGLNIFIILLLILMFVVTAIKEQWYIRALSAFLKKKEREMEVCRLIVKRHKDDSEDGRGKVSKRREKHKKRREKKQERKKEVGGVGGLSTRERVNVGG